MRIDNRTVQFFIGAATMGEGVGKWSWPARDLQYLYRRVHKPSSTASVEPDLETWKKHGCMTAVIEGQGLRIMKVSDFARHFGDEKLNDLLVHSAGTYLKESKDEILTTLGCP